MIPFCITNSLLVDACHVARHLHTDDKIQLLPIFIGFQWWTEQWFFFFLHEGHVKCAEQKQSTLHCNSLEYCVPFMQVSWQLCLPSTKPLFESVFPLHSPGHLLFLFRNPQFIYNCQTLCIPINWAIHFCSFLPPQLSQDTSFFYNMLSSVMPHSILNVLHKEALLQRLLNTVSGPDCDLDFAYP